MNAQDSISSCFAVRYQEECGLNRISWIVIVFSGVNRKCLGVLAFISFRARLVSGIGIRILEYVFQKHVIPCLDAPKRDWNTKEKWNTYSIFGPKKGFCNSTKIGGIGIRIPIPFFYFLENINFGVREFPSNIR